MERNKLISYLMTKIEKAKNSAFAYIPLTVKEVENIVTLLDTKKTYKREDKNNG